MSNALFQNLVRTQNDLAPTIARITAGVVMLPHGLQKTLGWFGGNGFAGTMDYFTGTAGLRRIRVEDGAIIKTHPVRDNILGLGNDGRRIWYSDLDDGRVRLVDPGTGTEVVSYELGGRPTGLAFVGRREFWYADAEAGKLRHVALQPRT